MNKLFTIYDDISTDFLRCISHTAWKEVKIKFEMRFLPNQNIVKITLTYFQAVALAVRCNTKLMQR